MLNNFRKYVTFGGKQDGQILITLLIVIPALILIVSSYLTLSTSGYRLAHRDQFRTQAQMAADAGADYAIEQINQDDSWTGTTSETTLQNDAQKKITYSVAVADNSSSSKTLTVVGKTYWPATSSTAIETVSLKIDLRAVSSGNYSVVSGEGGLFMNNSAKIVGGDVQINGTISLSNSAQIGLSTNAVNVNVADQVCPVPADATYPRICTAADNQPQPISISNTAHIYGSVKANNQTSGNGMSNPGLTGSSGVSAQPLPDYDRAAQKAAIATTITGASAGCSSGTKTWAANTKITGNVTISNTCKVTINGNIWISGNLSVANTAQLIVANSLGATVPVIMVDGSGGVILTQSAQLVSNTQSTGFEVITYWSAAGCSPDCTDVTGSSLSSSRAVTTISLTQSSQGPNTIFYSRWSQVSVNNTGQLGALVGQTVRMSNTATITFGTTAGGLGQTFWVVNGYRRSF